MLRRGQSGRRGLALLVLFLLAGCGVALAQLSTEDHVAEPGFWPTKGQPSLPAFAGETACARCHASILATQRMTSMRRTAVPAGDAEVLRQHPDLRFRFGNDLLQIQTKPENGRETSVYTASDGAQSLRFPLLWAFGTGRVGQSYLFRKQDGTYEEARVTFFQDLKKLDFTPARALSAPVALPVAMARQMQTSELIRCFSCHATAVNIGEHFNEAGMVAGVTCEACHGPGAQHVQQMRTGAGNGAQPAIYTPSHLSPTEAVEFCGACHGSWWDVKLAHVIGPSTVRSAPYRLVTSKCWGKEGDVRLECTACHNPHKELVTDIGSYDAACLRCHAGGPGQGAAHLTSAAAGGAPPKAPACPVATQKCASCHMPQVYVPEMKANFTDHRIRIVRAGEAFRD